MNSSLYQLATIENIDLSLDYFSKEELIDCILNFRITYFRLKKENEKLEFENSMLKEEIKGNDNND